MNQRASKGSLPYIQPWGYLFSRLDMRPGDLVLSSSLLTHQASSNPPLAVYIHSSIPRYVVDSWSAFEKPMTPSLPPGARSSMGDSRQSEQRAFKLRAPLPHYRPNLAPGQSRLGA